MSRLNNAQILSALEAFWKIQAGSIDKLAERVDNLGLYGGPGSLRDTRIIQERTPLVADLAGRRFMQSRTAKLLAETPSQHCLVPNSRMSGVDSLYVAVLFEELDADDAGSVVLDFARRLNPQRRGAGLITNVDGRWWVCAAPLTSFNQWNDGQ